LIDCNGERKPDVCGIGFEVEEEVKVEMTVDR